MNVQQAIDKRVRVGRLVMSADLSGLRPLARVAMEDLAGLGEQDLEALARSERVDVGMLKAELGDKPRRGELRSELGRRLFELKQSGRFGFVPGKTRCPVCAAAVTVRSEIRVPLDKGRVLVLRELECAGRRTHWMPHKSVERAEWPHASDAR